MFYNKLSQKSGVTIKFHPQIAELSSLKTQSTWVLNFSFLLKQSYDYHRTNNKLGFLLCNVVIQVGPLKIKTNNTSSKVYYPVTPCCFPFLKPYNDRRVS
ncbi:hypothetical protein XENOCAPTIV_014314 [Xenoophorus captivus]|uniref:Uncharacterized protein n=1 Tax=Xenoophorus captivus TaxID=1517983 RepID=A0ABV0S9Z0_9TELE